MGLAGHGTDVQLLVVIFSLCVLSLSAYNGIAKPRSVHGRSQGIFSKLESKVHPPGDSNWSPRNAVMRPIYITICSVTIMNLLL